MNDFSVTIGGDAGQGIESSGAGLVRAFTRAGWHVFSMVDYRSRIRGGHNFYQIRVGDRPFHSHRDPVHVLMAMTEETVKIHLDNVARGGAVIYDQQFRRVDSADIAARGIHAFAAPLEELAVKHGSKVMMNTAALGVAAGLMDVSPKALESVIRDNFADKGDRVAEANVAVLTDAHRWAQDHRGDFAFRLKGPGPAHRRMVVHGNHGIALGALAGGCRFMAAYPMTPGTSVFEYMVAHSRETGVVTKHAEDEIAAMCMVVGAAHAGARAMTSTSGGGFSLMVEALGMAGMVELPIVVLLAQRGGPSTGLPTRTEQGDLLFAVHASQGEFPRIILAPGTHQQCFETGWRAFNLAETFQCPVIILSDQFLASCVKDVATDEFGLDGVEIHRGATLGPTDLDRLGSPYRRFQDTETGISPRALPGHPAAVYALTTDEHDEESHISEEIGNRRQQMHKRMRKLGEIERVMRPPQWYGPGDADITLVCWGSTYGACREAVDEATALGKSVNVLHFTDLWPLPVERVQQELAGVRRAVAVEQNYTSQLTRLLRMATGYHIETRLNKFDGRPFAPGEIIAELDEKVDVYV